MDIKGIIPWRKETGQVARRRRDDGDSLLTLQRQMNGLFDDFFGRSPFQAWPEFDGSFAPRVDMSETGSEVRVTAELPGLDDKDIQVNLVGNTLSIKGEKKKEKEEEKGDYWHTERSYGCFERTMELPEGLDTDKVKATFKKGVLKVTIPKEPGAQRKKRTIEIAEG